MTQTESVTRSLRCAGLLLMGWCLAAGCSSSPEPQRDSGAFPCDGGGGEVSVDLLAASTWQEAIRQADAFTRAGHLTRAIPLLQRAHVLAASHGDMTGQMFSLHRLGFARSMLGRQSGMSELARSDLVAAMELAKKLKGKEAETRISIDLAQVLAVRLGQLSQGLMLLDQAALDSRTTRPDLEAISRVNAAMLAAQSLEKPAAMARIDDAWPLVESVTDRRLQLHMMLSLARAEHRLEGRFRQPLQAFPARIQRTYATVVTQAAQAGDQAMETQAAGSLGELYLAQQQAAEAEQWFRRAMFISQQLDRPAATARWAWGLGQALRAQGSLAEARTALAASVELIHPIRDDLLAGADDLTAHAGFRQDMRQMYLDLVDVLLRLARTSGGDADRQPLLRQAREIAELLKVAELTDFLNDRCIALRHARSRPVSQIGKNTAVIYIIPLPDRTELLVSDESEQIEQIVVNVSASDLNAQVTRLRRSLPVATRRDYLRPAQQLHRWLIEPIEQRLKSRGIDTLVFVPDGLLRTIPMAALHDGDQFLVDRFAVVDAPGMQLIDAAFRRQTGRDAMLLGLSQQVAHAPQFDALVHVQREIDHLSRITGGAVLMNGDFTSSRVTEEFHRRRFARVHVASHAHFGSDAESTFILTHDGKLTLNDLERLLRPSGFRDEPVDLLTLSACSTAVGDDRAALGLAGVAVKAGASSAVASLWTVEDESTALLMVRFYEILAKKPGITKAQALREAQQFLRQSQGGQFNHPRYWAPFMVIGNWR